MFITWYSRSELCFLEVIGQGIILASTFYEFCHRLYGLTVSSWNAVFLSWWSSLWEGRKLVIGAGSWSKQLQHGKSRCLSPLSFESTAKQDNPFNRCLSNLFLKACRDGPSLSADYIKPYLISIRYNIHFWKKRRIHVFQIEIDHLRIWWGCNKRNH